MPTTVRPYLRIICVALITLFPFIGVSAHAPDNGAGIPEEELELDVVVPKGDVPPHESCLNLARHLFDMCVAEDKVSDLECYIKYMLPTEITCECKRPPEEQPAYCEANSQPACDKFYDQCLLIVELRYRACLIYGPPNQSNSWGDPGLTCEGRRRSAIFDCQAEQQLCTCKLSDRRICGGPTAMPPLG
jgi:hypothetical protein